MSSLMDPFLSGEVFSDLSDLSLLARYLGDTERESFLLGGGLLDLVDLLTLLFLDFDLTGVDDLLVLSEEC